jgi:ribosomal protein L40E
VSSLKCPQCGLVNFSTATACQRCGTQLPSTASNAQSHGIVLEDGYVLPPPPQMPGHGVWRERNKLVMSRDAELPPRCVKCNVPTHLRIKRKLSWHHPALYLIIIVALLIYLIVALILRKSATVEIGLCDEHQKKRRRDIWITVALAVVGALGFALAIGFEDPTYLLLAFLALIAALIYGIAVARVVAPAKIDDRFVWLTGINKQYLNELPQWPGP